MKKHIRDVMMKARSEQNAVAALTVQNAEMIKTVLKVSKELSVPVLLMLGQKPLQHLDMKVMVNIARTYEDLNAMPVYLHLDHSRDLDQIRRAVELGFDSVMFDGSALPWNKNIELTKKVVDMASSKNVAVEAELGKIAGVEDDIVVRESDSNLTTPEEAVDFTAKTNIDWLAVSIGTAHGWYKEKPKLDYSRIKEIRAAVNVPLVMHGGSGLSDDAFRQAIQSGITKVNVDTELRRAFMSGLQEALSTEHAIEDLIYYFKNAEESLAATVRGKLQLFQTSQFKDNN
ncbi:class II fructose-bisphosphate aldolase [Desulfitobacterium sp. AusDCA]|uniref:class II fructose-bisphosphate aldolase n=1 Tax=Desulfitobacterium sp. AusDCA TaxID=3240383 RepID=UPI003DA743C6